ncbi:MAG: CmcI family methyltransferase [Anaerolineales bacterium]
MKIVIDTEQRTLCVGPDPPRAEKAIDLFSKEALEILSEAWIKVQWNQRHWQSLSWMGVQILQLPEDLLRTQEVLFRLKPDLIIETGVYAGGSAIFFASMCHLLGNGRVISIDISISERTRKTITAHPLGDYVTLIEGSSTDDDVIHQVREIVGQQRREATVIVFLDSDHSRDHVLRELQAYANFVSVGSYIVATDGVMEILYDTPQGRPDWIDDNPARAALEFVATNPKFVIERPPALFNDHAVVESLTYWRHAWITRVTA